MNALEFRCECGRQATVTALVDRNGTFQLHGVCHSCKTTLKWDLDPLLAVLRNAVLGPSSASIH